MTLAAATPTNDRDLAASPNDASSSVAANSVSVAKWRLLSRGTGFLRVVAIAAVLGPTFFGNLFQAANVLPNVLYELVIGSLISSLLMPALVKRIDAADPAGASRVAGGFTAIVLLVFGVVVVLGALLSPQIIGLLTIGVDNAGVRSEQLRVGWPLLVLVLPQLLLYGVAAIGAAAQNAQGRFALAAAAPAIENLGIVAILGVYALLFGTGQPISEISLGQVALLGGGATIATAAHAVVQWVAASRVGISLRPRAGWRDPEVRAVVKLGPSAAGWAILNGLKGFGVLIVAGSVAGGVVAFQLALAFFHSVVALFGRPVAEALLPEASRLEQANELPALRDSYRRSVSLSLLILLPAGLLLVGLAYPLAVITATGEMATDNGVRLIAASLIGLGAGVVGEGGFLIATHVAFARRDSAAPLRAMVVRFVPLAVMLVIIMRTQTDARLLLLTGAAVAITDIVGWLVLDRMVTRSLPKGGNDHLFTRFRLGLIALAVAVPVSLVARAALEVFGGRFSALCALALAGAAGVTMYGCVHMGLNTPEWRMLRSARNT